MSGPFALFLAPIAALKWLARRERWSLVLGGVAVACGVVQAAIILAMASGGGVRPPLGATPGRLLEIVGVQLVYGSLLGFNGLLSVFADPSSVVASDWLVRVAGAVGVSFLALVLWRAPLELRLVTVFGALILAAALVWPDYNPVPSTYWEILTAPGACNRYYFVLIFCIFASVVWLLFDRKMPVRIVGGAVLAFALVFGVRLDWTLPDPPNTNFERPRANAARRKCGEEVIIPINPPGWTMTLRRK